MRLYIKITLAFSCVIAFQAVACAQNGEDYVLKKHVHQLSQTLVMSADQEQSFFNVEKEHLVFLDSIQHIQTTPEAKEGLLNTQQDVYFQKQKAILSFEQWQKYTQILDAKRQRFLDHAASKKMKVAEINSPN